MIGFGRWRHSLIATAGTVAVLAGVASMPASGANGRLSALAWLQPGLWQLRNLDEPKSAPQAICIPDPLLLMQLRHRDSACTRLVVADGSRDAVVHYTCETSGFGQTSLRVETPRLAQIETQGIVNNAPFSFRAEARRIGACQSSARR